MGEALTSASRSGAPTLGLAARRSAGYYERAFRRFRRSKIGWLGVFIVVALVLLAVTAPLISPYPPLDVNVDAILEPPSSRHLMGTDEIGRDILSRIMYGSQVTLVVMALSIGLAVVAGSFIGLVSGYLGGKWDAFIMRVMDGLLGFPMLILALAIVAALGPKLENAVIAIGVTTTPAFARLVRGEVLLLKAKEYVTAAHSIGCTSTRIMVTHIWPNVTGTVIVFASLRAASAIITEASLSFLGLGAQPPTATWGSMVSFGMAYWNYAWWMSFFPGLAIFVTVLGLNLFGDTLRDAFDTRMPE